MPRGFGMAVVIAMALGLAVGGACHTLLSAASASGVAASLSVVTDLFLRLIKMIIAPLVLATLVSGIARMGDPAAVGRVGVKALTWFAGASVLSLFIGAATASLLHPGAGLALPQPAGGAPAVQSSLKLHDFLTHIVPTSLAQAMAENEILQLVVFSLFAGTALAALGGRVQNLVTVVEQVATMMLKITTYVMIAAPVAVFAALAATVATQGLAILGNYALFIGGYYLAIGLLWAATLAIAALVVGKDIGQLLSKIRQPVILAFSTASSEAAFPSLLEGLEEAGVPNRIASFVLPLGYSFNLAGSMVYATFTFLFVAQAYGYHLSFGQQAMAMVFLMLASKGIAGVPRAALVIIAAALAFFNMPAAGLLLVMGVDHVLDMGRSATNAFGNAIASAVVAKWEGAKLEPQAP